MKLFSRSGLGFSLIEVLTVLVIFGILCAYSMSHMTFLLNKNELTVIADEIKQALHFAKIEALTHAHTLTLAPLSDSSDWSRGMVLFVDNKTHQMTPETTPLREWRWRQSTLHVSWHGFESTHYLRFSPTLLERGANGYFILKDGERARVKLVVNRLARVREEKK